MAGCQLGESPWRTVVSQMHSWYHQGILPPCFSWTEAPLFQLSVCPHTSVLIWMLNYKFPSYDLGSERVGLMSCASPSTMNTEGLPCNRLLLRLGLLKGAWPLLGEPATGKGSGKGEDGDTCPYH